MLLFLIQLRSPKYQIKKGIENVCTILMGVGFLAGLSGLGVIIYPQGADAYSFYLKGLLQLFVHTCFFTFFIFYLSSISSDKRNRLVYWFLVGIVISSIYGFAQLILKIQYGIDIDESISRYLGMRLADGEYLNFARYGYGYLYRINGITSDPSVHAAYTIMALPLFLLGYIANTNIKYLILFLIVFVSLILSMSGSGLVGFVFSILALLVLRLRHIKISQLALVLFLSIILVFLYSSYEEHIRYYSQVRFDPEGTIASHLNIALKSLDIGLKYPLGVGYNNFSIAYENQYGISGYNPHNSWLGYFVQTGFIGVLYQIIFSFFIISKCFRKKTLLSQAFISSFIGICIASLGYQVFDMFYARLFIALFFTVVMLEESHKKPMAVKCVDSDRITDYYCQKDLPHQA